MSAATGLDHVGIVGTDVTMLAAVIERFSCLAPSSLSKIMSVACWKLAWVLCGRFGERYQASYLWRASQQAA